MVPVAGYLGRPIYYLECQCFGTFNLWDKKRRQSPLSVLERRDRLLRAFELSNRSESILILSTPMTSDDATSLAPMLSLNLMKTFPGANLAGENYWIYRVSSPDRL